MHAMPEELSLDPGPYRRRVLFLIPSLLLYLGFTTAPLSMFLYLTPDSPVITCDRSKIIFNVLFYENKD